MLNLSAQLNRKAIPFLKSRLDADNPTLDRLFHSLLCLHLERNERSTGTGTVEDEAEISRSSMH